MPVKYEDQAGQSMVSALAYQKALVRFAEAIVRYEHICERLFQEDRVIQSMSIRHPTDEGEDYLVTLRSNGVDGAQVAFHAASSLFEVLQGLTNRLTNNSLRWKADKYNGR